MTTADLILRKKSASILKFAYFSFYAGMGLFATFINLYYQSIGLSGMQIGVISMIGPAIGVINTTVWGMLNDRYGKIRWLITIAGLGSMLAVLALGHMTTFIGILFAVAWFSLFNSPIVPLVDSAVLRHLGNHRERYGSYRAWGTIGFIVTSSTIGFIYGRFGLQWMFPAYAVTMGLLVTAGLQMPNQPVRLGVSPLKSLQQIVRMPAWLVFAVSVFILWMCSAGALTFVSIRIRMLGGSDALIGIAWSVAALAELPFMFYGDRLLKRFGSARLLTIAFTFYIVRFSLYAMINLPIWAPFINLLQSVTYVFFWIGAVDYASELSPPELKSTSQGMLGSIINLANMAGALLDGWLFDHIGVANLYWALAGCCLVGLIIFTLGRYFVNRKQEGN
jgi:MFS transporter, PPP family, 3-phenylpropionic acid transporter